MKPHTLKLIMIAALAVSYGTNANAQSVASNAKATTAVKQRVVSTPVIKKVTKVSNLDKTVAPVNTPVLPNNKAQARLNATGANRMFESQREMGRMQQATAAGDRLTQLQSAGNDPASGTALGGRTLQGNGQVGVPDFSQYSNAAPSRDCITNPANCMSNNVGGNRGRFGAPPAAGASLNDQSGKASSGFTAQGQSINNQGSGYIKAVYVDSQGNTTSYAREYVPDANGGGTITTRATVYDENGKAVGEYTEHEIYDANGEIVDDGHQETGESMSSETRTAIGGYVKRTEDNAAERITQNEAGQPGVHDGSISTKDNCGWHPIVGCTKKSNKPDRDIAVNPARGEQQGKTGRSGTPQLNASAVTNSGDGGWLVSTYRSGGGRPLDMRDPSEGDEEGIGPVPRGGFAP